MANYHGKKGRAWTDKEVKLLVSMADRNVPQLERAAALKRTVGSVEGKLRLVRLAQQMGVTLGPGQARYERPEAIASDDAAHLRAVIAHGGFTWKERLA